MDAVILAQVLGLTSAGVFAGMYTPVLRSPSLNPWLIAVMLFMLPSV